MLLALDEGAGKIVVARMRCVAESSYGRCLDKRVDLVSESPATLERAKARSRFEVIAHSTGRHRRRKR